MSETPTGSGSWQASDGRWYPPEAHPDPSYRSTYVGFGSASGMVSAAGTGATNPTGYPVWFEFDGTTKVARWRAFVHLIMLIPHFLVFYLVNIVSQVISLVSWLVIVFTGKLPEGLHNVQTMALRYGTRLFPFAGLLTEQYPPFDFETTAMDRTGYCARINAVYVEQHNRLTTFFRLILVIPHMIVLGLVGIGAYIAYIIGWFAVLFTGRVPDGIANYLLGTMRWFTRVSGYFRLLTDEYPPFTLD